MNTTHPVAPEEIMAFLDDEFSAAISAHLDTGRSRLFRARTALRDLLVAPAPGVPAAKLAESEERV
jgi:hypothetical protein